MGLDHVPARSNVIDILDHVLDKGIVIDAWVRVSVGGIDLITVEARVFVASFQTYISYAEAMAKLPRTSMAVETMSAHKLRGVHERLSGVRKRLSAASGVGVHDW